MHRFGNVRIQLVLAWSFSLAWGVWWSLPLEAQKRVSSEKQALPELGNRPTPVLKVEHLKGTIKKVDLEKRTVTVAHSDGDTVFRFPTVAGKEKILLSKKASRLVGKKTVRLEEIPAGSQVKVAYYPELGTIMEIIIEELAR